MREALSVKKSLLAFTFATLFSAQNAVAMQPHQWHKSHVGGDNSLRGSAVYKDTLWVSGSNNGVYLSTNKGRSWQNVSVKSKVVTDFRDIEIFDDNTAIVMGVGTGESSRLYKTGDRGKSWQLLFTNPDEKGFFDAMGFFDKNTGLILGDPVDGYFVIYKTTDGGNTFRRIGKHKIPAQNKEEAAFAASGNTLLVGKGGKAWFTSGGDGAYVYSSTDFGESWQKEAVPIHDKTTTAGGYSLALNGKGQVFVLGGDYTKRDGEYVHIATKVVDTWVIPGGNVQSGLRTAMQCHGRLCLNTGKLATGISLDNGANWQLLGPEGYYTMAQGEGLFLMAGNDGRIGVITFN